MKIAAAPHTHALSQQLIAKSFMGASYSQSMNHPRIYSGEDASPTNLAADHLLSREDFKVSYFRNCHPTKARPHHQNV